MPGETNSRLAACLKEFLISLKGKWIGLASGFGFFRQDQPDATTDQQEHQQPRSDNEDDETHDDFPLAGCLANPAQNFVDFLQIKPVRIKLVAPPFEHVLVFRMIGILDGC